MALHGNDAVTKERYFELLRELDQRGYRSMACDLRGYSPDAAPQEYGAYNYNELAKDIFALADASGFDRFHVVSHDQGARLSWHAIAASQGRERFLSLATLAIPHADAFSDALCGPKADVRQQTASQYVTIMTLNTTESTQVFCADGDEAFCQRKFWWYNGAIDSGNMALAPTQSPAELIKHGSTAFAALRLRFPHANAVYGDDGVCQRTMVGRVSLPVLYACGVKDAADLCGSDLPFNEASAALADGPYTYLELGACGHDVAPCNATSSTDKCEGSVCDAIQGASNQVFAAIVANMEAATAVVV